MFILIFLLSVCASFIQRVSGFGFGIFVMMFFPYILPSYGESTMLSGLLAGSTALIISIRNWRYICWGPVLKLLLFNLVASFIAIRYMSTLDHFTLKKCFGVMFIVLALYSLFCNGRIAFIKNRWSAPILGLLSGVMGGMFAMPGPPIVLYCIERIEEKRCYITTLQAFSVILNIFYTVFRWVAGFFEDMILQWWCIGLCGVVIGSWAGKYLFERIDGSYVKKIVYLLLLVSGVISLF